MKYFLMAAVYFISLFTPTFGYAAESQASAAAQVSAQQLGQRIAQQAQPTNDAGWVNYAAGMALEECVPLSVLRWECVWGKLDRAMNAAKGDAKKAVVCNEDKTKCVPAIAYGQGVAKLFAINDMWHFGSLKVKRQPNLEQAQNFIRLVSEYGVNDETTRTNAMKYLTALIERAKSDCNKGSATEDTSRYNSKRSNYCAEGSDAMAVLAMLSKSKEEKRMTAELTYDLLKSRYDAPGGGMVMTGAVVAFGVLGTPRAYGFLRKFLMNDSVPSTFGNMMTGIDSPFKSTVQNVARLVSNAGGGNSRYLNRINEKFQYIDNREAKAQGWKEIINAPGRQYPYGNFLEDVGLVLGQQSASNPEARKLANDIVQKAGGYAKKKVNAAGVIHYPLVLGIMDGWRMSGKYLTAPSADLLTMFYTGDWFDINEGTQRRIHNKAYLFAKARGYNGDSWKQPAKNPKKIERYKVLSRSMTVASQGLDSVYTAMTLGLLVASLPAMGKGIANAIKVLSQRSTWIGTKDFIVKLPKTIKNAAANGRRGGTSAANSRAAAGARGAEAAGARGASTGARGATQTAAAEGAGRPIAQARNIGTSSEGATASAAKPTPKEPALYEGADIERLYRENSDLFSGGVQLYEKFAPVQAKQAKGGEKVITILKDGTRETPKANVAQAGDWIITNPGGEQYIVKPDVFAKKYAAATELGEGWFNPAGVKQPFIKIDRDIRLKAPWGEEQVLKKGSYVHFDPANPTDIYGVAPQEFMDTYKAIVYEDTDIRRMYEAGSDLFQGDAQMYAGPAGERNAFVQLNQDIRIRNTSRLNGFEQDLKKGDYLRFNPESKLQDLYGIPAAEFNQRYSIGEYMVNLGKSDRGETFALMTNSGKPFGVAVQGTKERKALTLKLNEVLDEGGIRARYSNTLEIEAPKVMETSFDKLPQSVRERMSASATAYDDRHILRGAFEGNFMRPKAPYIEAPMSNNGATMGDLGKITRYPDRVQDVTDTFSKALNGVPMTEQEAGAIKTLLGDLHRNGLGYDNIAENMSVWRNPDTGKIVVRIPSESFANAHSTHLEMSGDMSLINWLKINDPSKLRRGRWIDSWWFETVTKDNEGLLGNYFDTMRKQGLLVK